MSRLAALFYPHKDGEESTVSCWSSQPGDVEAWQTPSPCDARLCFTVTPPSTIDLLSKLRALRVSLATVSADMMSINGM